MVYIELTTLHIGTFGLSPDDVEGTGGILALQLAEKKFSKSSLKGYFSKQKQEELEAQFFAQKKNLVYKPGRFCLVDVILGKAYKKAHDIKRAVLCQIEKLDFSQTPVLFTIKTYITQKTLPIKYHIEEIYPLLAKPEKVDPKFKQILQQRDSRSNKVEVKVKNPEGKEEWVNIDDFLLSKQ